MASNVTKKRMRIITETAEELLRRVPVGTRNHRDLLKVRKDAHAVIRRFHNVS